MHQDVLGPGVSPGCVIVSGRKTAVIGTKISGGSNVWLSGANAGGLRSKQHKVVRGRNTRDDGTEPSINSIEAWWKNKKVKARH